MPAVVVGVLAARTAVPAVRATAPSLSGASLSRPPLAGTATAQTGERLGDGFGGIVRVGGHVSILHAT